MLAHGGKGLGRGRVMFCAVGRADGAGTVVLWRRSCPFLAQVSFAGAGPVSFWRRYRTGLAQVCFWRRSCPFLAQVSFAGAGPVSFWRRYRTGLAQVCFLGGDLRQKKAFYALQRRRSQSFLHTCANQPRHLRQKDGTPAPTTPGTCATGFSAGGGSSAQGADHQRRGRIVLTSAGGGSGFCGR